MADAPNGNGQSLNYEERLRTRRRTIKSFEAKFRKQRTWPEKFADMMTEFSGSIEFLVINFLWFTSWIVINTGVIPGIEPFDPYPFGFLTMVVSLEAIFLAIFVLISQNRQARVADLREEINLQVNMIAEEEITKIMHMIAGLYKQNKIKAESDPELERMMKPLNTSEIERRLEEQMRKDAGLFGNLKETFLPSGKK